MIYWLWLVPVSIVSFILGAALGIFVYYKLVRLTAGVSDAIGKAVDEASARIG